MDKIKSIRGMHDLFGNQFLIQKKIIDKFEFIANKFNFKPIATPIMEFSEVFNRTLGNSSDVVMKEMYTFQDRNNESLTLRPEGTAGIARAVISNGMTQDLPLKFYYYGSMFRYERPQKGRLRQFNQIGLEMYAKPSLNKDFEILSLAEKLFKTLNINNDLVLRINNLGSLEDRRVYIEKLKNYYLSYKNRLSKDSLIRLEKNPLRILDSKDLDDIKINENAPRIDEHLSADSNKYYTDLTEMLQSFDISFVKSPFLVRGLDYYNNTIFEFTLKHNSKFAILAGGTYDNLVSDLGGPRISGTGWAAGLERLASLVKLSNIKSEHILLVPMDKNFLVKAHKLRQLLFDTNFSSEVCTTTNLKKALKYANKIKAGFALIIGIEELNKNYYSIKNLKTGEQKLVKESSLIEYFKNA